MAKLRVIRITLITLQLISVTIASVIIIVHYNPWIERMIVEAERSGNTSQSLADQIGRIEGEEIVIFLMSSATILVSLIGVIGTLRGHEHNHCLLNFYMSTLIIFLFVIFVALCGTIWEMIWKLQYGQSIGSTLNNSKYAPHDTYHLVDDEHQMNMSIEGRNMESNHTIMTTTTATTTSGTTTISSKNAQSSVTWMYICKSFIFISLSASLYAVSLKLTRKILESSDDRYLSAGDGDEDDLNSEASSYGTNGIHHYINAGGVVSVNGQSKRHKPYNNHSFNFQHNIAGSYNSRMLSKPSGGVPSITGSNDSSVGTPFRNI